MKYPPIPSTRSMPRSSPIATHGRVYRSAPRRAAAAPASRRDATPSFASTAETWWSTVLGVMTSAAAISAFVAPEAIRASTSTWRGVRPAGPAREAGRGGAPGVRRAGGDQGEPLARARRRARRPGAGGRARPARDPPHAGGAQPAAQARGRARGAELVEGRERLDAGRVVVGVGERVGALVREAERRPRARRA